MVEMDTNTEVTQPVQTQEKPQAINDPEFPETGSQVPGISRRGFLGWLTATLGLTAVSQAIEKVGSKINPEGYEKFKQAENTPVIPQNQNPK